MKRHSGTNTVILLAAGILIAAACGPTTPRSEPPTLEAFSRAGLPPEVADRGGGTPAPGAYAADGLEGSDGIYVRSSEDGGGFITNVNTADDDGPRRPSTNRLYRWRDDTGRDYITDSKPPPGARVLADLPK